MPLDPKFIDAVKGHMDTLAAQEGGGEVPKEPTTASNLNFSKTPADYDLDVRDIIANFVGKGRTLRGDDQSAYISRLGVILGKPQALKLVNHLFLFNQRDDVKGKSFDQKLESFYNIKSGDNDIDSLLSKTKNLGYGVHEGAQTSVDVTNKELTGRKVGDEAKQSQSDKIKTVADSALPK